MKNSIKKTISLLSLLFCFSIFLFPGVKAEAGKNYSFDSRLPVENGVYKEGERIHIRLAQNYNSFSSAKTYDSETGQWTDSDTEDTQPNVTVKICKGNDVIATYSYQDFGWNDGISRSVVFTPNVSGDLELSLYVGKGLYLNDEEQELEDVRHITVEERKHETIVTSDVPVITNVKRTAKKKAKITWFNPTRYATEIYRSTKKNGKYKLIKTVKSNVYTDSKLSDSKVYYYKIRLVDEYDAYTTYYSQYSSVKAVKPMKKKKK